MRQPFAAESTERANTGLQMTHVQVRRTAMRQPLTANDTLPAVGLTATCPVDGCSARQGISHPSPFDEAPSPPDQAARALLNIVLRKAVEP